jgi:spore germination cell wall hydrolase CwlJ-like protein
MRIQDQFMLALTIWRENRGGGQVGMQSVANVVMNRVAKRGSSAYAECVRPWQFSSITAKGDPELALWPADADASWALAQQIAGQAAAGTLEDLTSGALLYYAPHAISSDKTYTLPDGTVVAFPHSWNPLVLEYVTEIAGQLFFRENG